MNPWEYSGAATAWVSRAYFFSGRKTFDYFSGNQINQTAGAFTAAKPVRFARFYRQSGCRAERPFSERAFIFHTHLSGADGSVDNCREIQGGGGRLNADGTDEH
jgi:hypothetical protein